MKRNIEFDEIEWFGVGYTICCLYVLVKAGRFIHISLSLLHYNEFFIDIDVSFCTKIKKKHPGFGPRFVRVYMINTGGVNIYIQI